MKTSWLTSRFAHACHHYPLQTARLAGWEPQKSLDGGHDVSARPSGLLVLWSKSDLPEFLWPWSMSCVSPVWGSQNCTPLSFEPLSTHSPSGVSATLRTKSWNSLTKSCSLPFEWCERISALTLWPSNVLKHLALRGGGFPGIGGCLSPNSHILIDLSRLPLTRDRPLGAKATE